MRRFIIGVVCMILLLAGCRSADPAETCTPLPDDVHRPTLEEIQEAYGQEAELVPASRFSDLDLNRLWDEMHIQLVQGEGVEIIAVFGNMDSKISLYWMTGGVLCDLNGDGYTELIGYTTIGHGIASSAPFVLWHTGEITRDEDSTFKLLPLKETGELKVCYEYTDFWLSDDGKSVAANAIASFSKHDDKHLRIFFEDGNYYYEYH